MYVSNLNKLILDHSPREILRFIRRGLHKYGHLQGFDDKHPCVFVLSTGRTGTKTLAAILGLAKNIIAFHEPKPELYGLSKLSYEYSNKKNILLVLREGFLTARRDLLNYSLSHGKGYVETSPQTTFLASIILDTIANVRFIHLVRDPRYVIRSGMRRKWYNGNSYDKSRIVPRNNSKSAQYWKNCNTFQKNLWLWAETNRWILNFFQVLGDDQKILIKSEDLFNNNENTMNRLFDFIGGQFPPNRKIIRILNKKLNAQKEGDFREFNSWSKEMQIDFVNIIGNAAKSLGYKYELLF